MQKLLTILGFIAVIGCLVLIMLTMSGCGTISHRITINADGTVATYEVIDADIIGSLVESAKNKTIIVWHTGWAFGLKASPGTMDDPTPSVKIVCGKFNDGYISILKDQGKFNWIDIAKVIEATNNELTATATGISEAK